jgi:hypothetical protein
MAGSGEEDGRPDGGGPDRGREPDAGRSGQPDHDLHQWDRELGGYGYRPGNRPDPRSPLQQPSSRIKTAYFVMMGTCLGLCAIAWTVVSRYSTLAAVIMSAAALAIPPLAAIIANSSSAADRRRLPRAGPAPPAAATRGHWPPPAGSSR